jgi:hypothetical protein
MPTPRTISPETRDAQTRSSPRRWRRDSVAADRARFLWDKWKHHDTLAYSRVQQYFQITAFIIAAAGLLWVNDERLLAALILALGGLYGVSYRVLMRKDMWVRNSFNPSLVGSLRSARMLQLPHIEPNAAQDWRADDYQHSTNQWHFDPGLRDGSRGLGIVNADMLITGTAALQWIAAWAALVTWYQYSCSATGMRQWVSVAIGALLETLPCV